MAWTVVVPARAGSRGVIGKNYQQVAGKPLVCHTIDVALATPEVKQVIVSTNDPMVESVVLARYGTTVGLWGRPPDLTTDDATIDDLCRRLAVFDGLYPLCVIQPTTIGLTPTTLSETLRTSSQPSSFRGGPYTLVVGRKKTDWVERDGELHPPPRGYDRRNIPPTTWTEIGVRIHPTPWDDDTPYQPLKVEGDFLDVDTPEDLERARHRLDPLVVRFQPVANTTVGLGHLYRCLVLAERLQHYQVEIDRTLIDLPDWRLPPQLDLWSDRQPRTADVTVLDRLDTTPQQVLDMRSDTRTVVTLEDRGEGAEHADVVISDMYPSGRNTKTEHVGAQYAVLRPEFLAVTPNPISTRIETVLVAFGGMDASRLTEQYTSQIVQGPWVTTLVPPPGRTLETDSYEILIPTKIRMAHLMAQADLVVTSAGRTLYEAAATRTPAIAIAQNRREEQHLHLGWGNVYLGPGWFGQVNLFEAVEALSERPHVREQLREEAETLVDLRGTERVAKIIEETARCY